MSRISRLRALIVLAVALSPVAAAATTPQGYQCLSRADIVTQVTAGLLTWKTSQPSGWATDHTMANWTDFTTNVANTGSCAQPAGSANGLMNWSTMIACAVNHVVSQQSLSASGSYSGDHYTATKPNGIWICRSVTGTGPFVVTLPAGTVAPTSGTTQLSLALSGIGYGGSTTLSAQLYNPSGVAVGSAFSTSSANPPAWTYSAAGAPAGAWHWQISSSGASGQTCDPDLGLQGSYDAASWSGTATYYQ